MSALSERVIIACSGGADHEAWHPCRLSMAISSRLVIRVLLIGLIAATALVLGRPVFWALYERLDARYRRGITAPEEPLPVAGSGPALSGAPGSRRPPGLALALSSSESRSAGNATAPASPAPGGLSDAVQTALGDAASTFSSLLQHASEGIAAAAASAGGSASLPAPAGEGGGSGSDELGEDGEDEPEPPSRWVAPWRRGTAAAGDVVPAGAGAALAANEALGRSGKQLGGPTVTAEQARACAKALRHFCSLRRIAASPS